MKRCRICGCTDDDCSFCIVLTGVPCHWVEPDLCSACQIDPAANDYQRAMLIADAFSIKARERWGRVPGGVALAMHATRVRRICVHAARSGPVTEPSQSTYFRNPNEVGGQK